MLDAIEETVTAGGSKLTFDAAGLYVYVWKTDKAWGGTCRLMNVRWSDGVAYTALFQFTR